LIKNIVMAEKEVDAVNAVCVCVIRDDGAVRAGSEVIYSRCLRVPEAQHCVGCSRNRGIIRNS